MDEEDRLIFPDERRGLTPYSLICGDCGNYKIFYYDVHVKAIVTVMDDKLIYNYGREIRKSPLSKEKMAAMILERHRDNGATVWNNIKEDRQKITCGNCSSENIVLYGDAISECYTNRCVGCFKCGGAFNREYIEDYCKQCISLRSMMTEGDNSLFFMTLDMDLFCDACPIEAVRLDYGITGDAIKRQVSGKLV